MTTRTRASGSSSGSGSKVSRQGSYRATDLPDDESDLLARIHTALQAAMSDGKTLLDVEVPVNYFSGVVGVGGSDSIAISEYNANMVVLRKVVRLFEWLGQSESVRVFFPDAAECSIALKGAGMNPVSGQWEQEATFHDWPGAVDYLLRDDFISQTSRKAYGLSDLPEFLAGKRDVEDTAEVADRLYVVGYPYDSSSEMEQVMRLWEVGPWKSCARPAHRRCFSESLSALSSTVALSTRAFFNVHPVC